MNKTIIFFDSGDTIIDESTQIFDEDGKIVQTAECIPGAKEILHFLYSKGHTLALVADGRTQSFENVYRGKGLYNCFAAHIYSEAVQCEKPNPKIFLAAMQTLNLKQTDIPKIIMIGNNLARDIAGANKMGITSIFYDWSPRYPKIPETREQIPDYTIKNIGEILDIVHALDVLRERRYGG